MRPVKDHSGLADGVVSLLNAVRTAQRMQILLLLEDGRRSVGELAEGMGLLQPSISRHLAILRLARLVTSVQVGHQKHVSLTEAAHRFLAGIRAVVGEG